MPSLQQIGREITAIKDRYIFFTEKEIRYLPNILGENEHILGVTSGFVNKATWLAVCTNKRVLFINTGMIFGLHQVQMNLDRIQSIDSSHGLFFGRIRVWDGASSISIGLVLKRSVGPFVKTVQQAMDDYKRHVAYDLLQNAPAQKPAAAPTAQAPEPAAATTPAASSASAPDHNQAMQLIAELERLSKLNQQGAITDEEFVIAKNALLTAHN
jgi:hypothetical protein